KQELIGLTDLDLFPREVAEFFRETDRQMMSEGKSRRNEEWLNYPDGRRALFDTLKTPFYDAEGTILGLIGISRDITLQKRHDEEKKTLESQLHQAQKMEAIGQLAGGIAHDFNNILTAIIGYSEIISMKLEKTSPLGKHLEQVLVAAERAAELTNGLLAFSRKQVLHTKPLDLCQVVEGVEKMLRRLIPEDIDFKTVISEEVLTVMADKGQIEQVLMNLVTNAKDAMPKGGMLSITVASITINESFMHAHGFGKPGSYAVITVSDTGHGMDKKTLEKIFEPFFTTKETGKGTGLGMAIIYGIVKQHNGYITVESEKGKGTKFSIYLPLVIEDGREERMASEAEALPRGTETILLVEDDETVRELHRMMLEEAGYRVITAVDGQDALDKFDTRQLEVDLLVTDVIMPRMDGKRLFEEIRAVRSDIRALFISGYTKDVFVARGILDEEFSFIMKPVSSSVLLAGVREALDH
ncbi:MAG TPA: ATP-binding protein, partial [Geobacteraceae bacterium]|nr:ATP-binding protein [Geobacteraceae bacterium]